MKQEDTQACVTGNRAFRSFCCVLWTHKTFRNCVYFCCVLWHRRNAVMTIVSCWWLYQFFTLPFLSMGIGGHALLIFVTICAHLFLTKFHTYLLISPKVVVAVSCACITAVNFLFWLCLLAGVMQDFLD